MAYNRNNYLKRVSRVIKIYNSLKESDIPDTRIVKFLLPEHGIDISYRTLMIYKGMKPSEYNPPQQPTLFSQAS